MATTSTSTWRSRPRASRPPDDPDTGGGAAGVGGENTCPPTAPRATGRSGGPRSDSGGGLAADAEPARRLADRLLDTLAAHAAKFGITPDEVLSATLFSFQHLPREPERTRALAARHGIPLAPEEVREVRAEERASEGGGLGAVPYKAQVLYDFLPEAELLPALGRAA